MAPACLYVNYLQVRYCTIFIMLATPRYFVFGQLVNKEKIYELPPYNWFINGSLYVVCLFKRKRQP